MRFAASASDQMTYLGHKLQVFDPAIHCVITLDGRVDAGRMARAVRLTVNAEPVLGCRFVEHPWRPYWEQRDDLDSLPPRQRCEDGDDGDGVTWIKP